MLPFPRHCCSALLILFASGVAGAAQWDVVVRDRSRVVELDRTSILPSDPGTMVAWGRIVLTEADQASTGYASVKALNRYDCKARSFSTVKRVYLDGDHNVLREERVTDPHPLAVEPGSVDERLWREVCKPPSAKGLAALAEEAGKAAAKAGEHPAPAPVAEAAPRVAPPKVEAPESKPMRRADFHPAAEGERADKTRSNDATPPSHEPAPPPAPSREVAKPISPPPLALPPKPAPPTPGAEQAPAAPLAKVAPPARPVPVPPQVARKPVPEADSAHAHQAMHWSYEGEAGPEHWGKMNPEWSACAKGQRQSPVDIRDGILVDQEPLRFDYKPGGVKIVDNGHTVQVTPGDGNTLMAMGRRFELVQFHFHRPSEERVDGRAFDMVAHLVHRDQDGRLGVVAVLMEVGATANPVIQTLWNNLPLEKKTDFIPSQAIDLNQLLPEQGGYFAYMGSLTTPPCSEDVLWMVFRQPLQISEEQLKTFARLYPRNIRPIQRLNDRLIKASR